MQLIQSLPFSSRILVEGKLDYGEYVDKNQVRRQATTIIAGQWTNTYESFRENDASLTCRVSCLSKRLSHFSFSRFIPLISD